MKGFRTRFDKLHNREQLYYFADKEDGSIFENEFIPYDDFYHSYCPSYTRSTHHTGKQGDIDLQSYRKISKKDAMTYIERNFSDFKDDIEGHKEEEIERTFNAMKNFKGMRL